MLDTNVLFRRSCFQAEHQKRSTGECCPASSVLLTSRPLLGELARVLTRKFGWSEGYVHEVLAQLVRVGVVVEPDEEVSDILDDPADNRVLEAAAQGGARSIVSGDRHLLRLTAWRGIPILTPAQLIDAIR